MRRLSSLKYHPVDFLLSYIYLILLISVTLRAFDTDSETKCEYEDANLIWRNTLAYSVIDVKAIAWYKGKGSLIATWLDGKGFVEYPPYIGRLMQIEETGIKIKTANRSDSGTYWISLTLASVDDKLEAATHLEVMVAPLSQCKPSITKKGSFMKAELPPDGCGIPRLVPEWRRADRDIFQESQNSSSFLYPEPGEYIVCAEGESANCYNGNISDLCTRFTTGGNVLHKPSDHGWTTGVLFVACAAPLFIVVVLTVLAVGLYKHGICCRKRKNESEDLGNDLIVIQNYLKKLYESLTTVSLFPINDEKDHINVSNLYINIEFGKEEFGDLNNWENNASSSEPRDHQPLLSYDQAKRNNRIGPILIFGDCGSGKSTWCKHLVQCWLQNTDNNDANIQDLNLPDLRNIQILLYLPLQFSDRGLSLQKLLEKYLFKEQTTYQAVLVNYVEKHAKDVLIVMDGLDVIRENEKTVSELLHDDVISSCNVIITSRPTSFQMLQDTCSDKIQQIKFLRIRKMDTVYSKQYVKRYLETINGQHGKALESEKFLEFTEHLQMQSLLGVPYICLLMLHIWMENKAHLIEATDILLHIINYYLHRAMTDHQRKELIEKAFNKKSANVTKYITKLNNWPLLVENEYILYVLSGVAAEIFATEMEPGNSNLKVLERSLITDNAALELHAICETGILTESLSMSANKKASDLSFSDKIIYEFFVSIYIALKEDTNFDYIVSSGNACLHNSMIIHMLFQLSHTVVKYIMDKARKYLEIESINNKVNQEGSKSKETFLCSIKENPYLFKTQSIMWLQWLMCNDTLHGNKLLFLTTALRVVNTVTCLALEKQSNNDRLVFWLPLLPTLETLTLNINNCTLLLCKEWYDMTPVPLNQVSIKDLRINKDTLGLLLEALGLCTNLEMMEISPALPGSDNNGILPEIPDLTEFSLRHLSNIILQNKKLKALRLNNLSLISEIDILPCLLNYYKNLETLELRIRIVQKQLSLLHSPCNVGPTNDDDNSLDETNIKELALKELRLLHGPVNLILYKTKKIKMEQRTTKGLHLVSVDIPPMSWETLGNQIGTLNLSEVHLQNVSPRGSAQILLDGIGQCAKLKHFSLIQMDTADITPDFSFLKNLNGLLTLHLEYMNFDVPSTRTFFQGLSGCKKLKTLSFRNMEMETIPETLCFDLKELIELTIDKVRITEGSGCLYTLLDSFKKCKNLKTISIRNVKETQIPPELCKCHITTQWS